MIMPTAMSTTFPLFGGSGRPSRGPLPIKPGPFAFLST
jgi:hypothetical protein